MKQEIFLYLIGTAGSGKSTLAHTFKQWTNVHGIDSVVVNLDPGAENLPYSPDVGPNMQTITSAISDVAAAVAACIKFKAASEEGRSDER